MQNNPILEIESYHSEHSLKYKALLGLKTILGDIRFYNFNVKHELININFFIRLDRLYILLCAKAEI